MDHPSKGRYRSGFGLLLAGLLVMPAMPVEAAQQLGPPSGATSDGQELIARKGGGGGGGGSRTRASKGASGFRSSGSGLNRGASKPSGGWASKSSQKGGPSLDSRNRSDSRQGRGNDDRSGNRSERAERAGDRGDNRNQRRDDRTATRDDRSGNRDDRRDDRWDRRDDRWDDRGNRWDRRWDRWDNYPGWARPGWGYARPWNYGWYGGWASPSWGWWGASAAAWGVTTLATAAIINAAVDDAVSSHTTTIVVPNTDYRLLYGSVEPLNEESVSFSVESGDREVAMNADCKRGTLDGRNPSTAQEAELLNAACQVAFGDV
ncbi:MAG: hypothetical protein VKM34_04025 [Cyanobacteriota bacterium]|nr:hypothetical protein [Cyanobacteriota bacterium]